MCAAPSPTSVGTFALVCGDDEVVLLEMVLWAPDPRHCVWVRVARPSDLHQWSLGFNSDAH